MTETDWVPGDWGTIKLDAVVKIEHADGSEVHGKIGRGLGRKVLVSKFGVRDLDTLKFDGWNLFVPKPTQPELPTEAGYYIDAQADLWILDRHGYWECPASPSDSNNPQMYVPFTRLLPEAETAKKIIERIDSYRVGGEVSTLGQVQTLIAAEFGVSLD